MSKQTTPDNTIEPGFPKILRTRQPISVLRYNKNAGKPIINMYLTQLMRKVIHPKDYGHYVRELIRLAYHLQFMTIIYSDSLTKSNILNNYFTSALTKEDTTSIPSLSSQPCLDIDSLVISTQRVIIQLLKDLDQYKSKGPDGLPARFLKEMAIQIAPALVLIYQASLNQRVLLDDWLKAKLYQFTKRDLA